jgi:hypothetical protein
MNLKRTATLAFVVAALAVCAWLAAAATLSTREPVARVVARLPPIDVRGAALAEEISRLHEHLRPSAVPRQPGRNLFSFPPRPIASLPPPPPRSPKPALSETTVARPAAPVMKLSGIAEDVTAGGVVRTAIISAFGQLFLVKEGEQVTERYRVAKISSDVVELSDLSAGTALRFALK